MGFSFHWAFHKWPSTNPKDKDKVIGLGKPNEVSKKAHGSVELANESRKPKENNRVVDAQRDIGTNE